LKFGKSRNLVENLEEGAGEDLAKKVKDKGTYLGNDKKFGRAFFEMDGFLYVIPKGKDGKSAMSLGSMEVKSNQKMVKGLVKEETELEEAVKVGDTVHLGHGTKGGTGVVGKVTKIQGGMVHIENEDGDTFKGPMSRVTVKESVELDEEKFTSSQLSKLKQEYGKLKSVDPGSETYKKLTAFLDGLSTEQLKQMVDAKIPFLRSLALNRINRRKIKGESVETDGTFLEEGLRSAFKGGTKEINQFQAKLKELGMVKTYLNLVKNLRGKGSGYGIFAKEEDRGEEYASRTGLGPSFSLSIEKVKGEKLGVEDVQKRGDTTYKRTLVVMSESVELDEAHYATMEFMSRMAKRDPQDFIDYINMKKMGEAEVFQKRGINFLRVRVRMPDHMKELNRVAGGFGFFAGDVVKEETLDEMSAKDHWRKFKSKGVVAAIDKDKYPNREKEGLEGPYRTKKGLVYYYDRKEGKYYDPDTDMYLDVKDVMEETELNENKFREVLNKGKKLGDWNMLSYFLYDGNVWMLQSGRAVNQGKLEDFKKKAQKGLLKSIGLDEETLDEAAGDVELTYPNADAAKVFASTMTRKGVKGIVVKGKKVIFNITDFNKASSIKEPLSHFVDKAKTNGAKVTAKGFTLDEVSPPGWEGTVKAMKKKKGDEKIENPWALAWWMKGKGYKSHYTKDGKKKD